MYFQPFQKLIKCLIQFGPTLFFAFFSKKLQFGAVQVIFILPQIKCEDQLGDLSALLVQDEKQTKRSSSMSLQVCPALSLNAGHGEQLAESACHVSDARSNHKCFGDEECGVDSTSCRRRSCSMAGYCGLWLVV